MDAYYDYTARIELARPTVVTGYLSDFSRGVAYRASALLGLTYHDVERSVEHEAGMEISRLVLEYGEPRYREIETRALARSLEQRPAGLIALGDGGLLDAGNLERVQTSAKLIVLDFELGNLVWRAQQLARQHERGWWHSLYRDPPNSVADLRPFYQERRAGFDHADALVAASSLSVARACEAIMVHLAD